MMMSLFYCYFIISHSRVQSPSLVHRKQKKCIIIIIIKKDWQCKAGRGRLTPYLSEDLSPTLTTYGGKEEKGKIVEDKKGESN